MTGFEPCLGDQGRFGEVMTVRLGAPAEGAAGPCGVDGDLVRGEAEHRAGDHLVHRLELGPGPERGGLTVEENRDVERFHRRVGQEGEAVVHLDDLGRVRECGLGVSMALGDGQALFSRHRREFFSHFRRAAGFCLAVVPGDVQKAARLDRRPGGVCQNRHAAGHGNDVDHALHLACFGVVEAGRDRAEFRRAGQDGDEHVFRLMVHAEETDGAVGLVGSIDAREILADMDPVFRFLQGRFARDFLLGGKARQIAEGRRFAARMGGDALCDGNFRSGDAPVLGCSCNEHGPGGGTGLTILHEGIGDRAGTARSLHAEGEILVNGGVRRSEFGCHLCRVCVQFFGDQSCEASGVALPHVLMLVQDDDRVVGPDVNERLDEGGVIGGGPGGARHAEREHQAAGGTSRQFQEGAAAGSGRLERFFKHVQHGSGLHLVGGEVYRLTDPGIGGAAADIAVHGRIDVFVGRLGRFDEKGRCRHDLTGLAVTALGHLQFLPGGLNGLGCLAVNAFDGGDGCVADIFEHGLAGTDRHAVQMDRAGAALGNAATEFRSGHAEFVTKHPQKRCFRVRVDRARFSIDGEGGGHRERPPLACHLAEGSKLHRVV